MAKVNFEDYGDLAFLPMEASAPFSETLSWKTDLFNSFRGNDSAIALRQVPRQSFSMNYAAQPKGPVQDAFNTVYAALANRWAIPCWHESVYVGTVAAGAVGLAIDTTIRDFRAGSLALIWGGCNGQWELVQLTTVDSGAVTFPATVGQVRNAYFMPVRIGRVPVMPTRRIGGLTVPVHVEYEVDDNIAFVPDAPDQFLGNDIYFDVPVLGSGEALSERITTQFDVHDGDVGPVVQTSAWDNNRVSRQHRVVCENPAEAWAYKMWLHRREGRHRPFWQPSFTHDLRLASLLDLGGSPYELSSVIRVFSDSYHEWAQSRVHLAFQSRSTGDWVVRTVEDVSTPLVGNEFNMSLDDDVGIMSNDLARICYLGLKRLDTDRVEIDWLGNGVCESAVQIVEMTP